MDRLELCGMEFYSYHGCFQQERICGGRYIVDCICNLDLTKAAQSDNLNDTVDYPKIYEIIKRDISTPANLIEHLAGRIISSIKADFPQIESVTITISKLNPPIDGSMAAAKVTLTR